MVSFEVVAKCIVVPLTISLIVGELPPEKPSDPVVPVAGELTPLSNPVNHRCHEHPSGKLLTAD